MYDGEQGADQEADLLGLPDAESPQSDDADPNGSYALLSVPKWSKVKETTEQIASFAMQARSGRCSREDAERILNVAVRLVAEVKAAQESHLHLAELSQPPVTIAPPPPPPLPFQPSSPPSPLAASVPEPHGAFPLGYPQAPYVFPSIPPSQLPDEAPAPPQPETPASTPDPVKVPRKRGRIPRNRSNLVCRKCGVTDTPEWRRGPEGPNTFCNACGLQYSKSLRREKETRSHKAAPAAADSEAKPDDPSIHETSGSATSASFAEEPKADASENKMIAL